MPLLLLLLLFRMLSVLRVVLAGARASAPHLTCKRSVLPFATREEQATSYNDDDNDDGVEGGGAAEQSTNVSRLWFECQQPLGCRRPRVCCCCSCLCCCRRSCRGQSRATDDLNVNIACCSCACSCSTGCDWTNCRDWGKDVEWCCGSRTRLYICFSCRLWRCIT